MSEEMKLLPCPFCGQDESLDITDNGESCFWVVCNAKNCGSEGAFQKTPKGAITAWNTRTQPRKMPSEDVNDTDVVEINTQLIADFKACAEALTTIQDYGGQEFDEQVQYSLTLTEKYKQLFEEVK